MITEGNRIPHEEENFDTTKEKVDRKSPQFFIDLKDSMVEEIGMPDHSEAKHSLYKISNELGNLQTIDTTLKERSQGKLSKVIDPLKDKFRKEVPAHFMGDKSIAFGRRNEDFVRKIKTSDLAKWREYVTEYLKRLEEFQSPLNMLEDIELHSEAKQLLAKYNKSKVYELLEPGLEMTETELSSLAYDIASSLEYRNRKIKEFVAYRYARTAPTDDNEENFVKNVHKIIDKPENESRNNGYRTSEIKNSDTFNAPFHPSLLPYAMATWRTRIENTGVSNSKLEIQKSALKAYIIFEIIHPFNDGNGRTGRALFVHLQRRFAAKESQITPTHMPIARYESGTIYAQEVKDGKFPKMHLGSLSLDVNELLTRIIQKEDIIALGKELPGWYEFEQNKLNPAELQEIVDTFIDNIAKKLESPEVDKQLEELCIVIEKQSSQDDISSKDWGMVYESLKEKLKSKT